MAHARVHLHNLPPDRWLPAQPNNRARPAGRPVNRPDLGLEPRAQCSFPGLSLLGVVLRFLRHLLLRVQPLVQLFHDERAQGHPGMKKNALEGSQETPLSLSAYLFMTQPGGSRRAGWRRSETLTQRNVRLGFRAHRCNPQKIRGNQVPRMPAGRGVNALPPPHLAVPLGFPSAGTLWPASGEAHPMHMRPRQTTGGRLSARHTAVARWITSSRVAAGVSLKGRTFVATCRGENTARARLAMRLWHPLGEPVVRVTWRRRGAAVEGARSCKAVIACRGDLSTPAMPSWGRAGACPCIAAAASARCCSRTHSRSVARPCGECKPDTAESASGQKKGGSPTRRSCIPSMAPGALASFSLSSARI